jgi:hypothetical protein
MSAGHRIAARLLHLIPGSRALGLRRDLRDLADLAEADVALVSFPKSGRTFVRAMLARLYQLQFGIDERELLEFATLRQAPREVPRLLFTHDGDAMRRPSEIRLDKRIYAGKKVVLLVRHPGDIVVSRYHHLKHRSEDRARQRLAEQPLDAFVWTEQGGIPAIVTFLNQWAAHARERSGIAISRYEDFLSDPQPTLRTLAGFIGLDHGDAAIAEAVECARFDNLKEKEREGYYSSSRLRPAAAGDESSFKVRSGKAGGFRTELSEDQAAAVDAYVARHLDAMFGYGQGEG